LRRALPPLFPSVLLAFVALTAGEAAAAAARAGAPAGLTIGAPRSLTYFPLHAARELGYFDEEGISVTFFDVEEHGALEALGGGRADLVGAPAALAIEASRRGPRVQLVMAVQARSAAVLVARGEAGLAPGAVAALRGRRVAAPEGQRGLELALRAILRGAGLAPGRDVRLEAVAARRILAALQAGRVDAAILPGEMAAQAIERQRFAAVLVDLRRGEGPPAAQAVAMPTLQGMSETLTRRRDAVRRAVRAVTRAQRRLRGDTEFAAQVAERALRGADPQLIRAVLEAEAPGYRPAVSREAVAHLISAFPAGRGPAPEGGYEQIVATAFAPLWAD